MVEVLLNQPFPDSIQFENEKGILITQDIEYEWSPMYCSKCHGYGHDAASCNKGAKRKYGRLSRRWRYLRITLVKLSKLFRKNTNVLLLAMRLRGSRS